MPPGQVNAVAVAGNMPEVSPVLAFRVVLRLRHRSHPMDDGGHVPARSVVSFDMGTTFRGQPVCLDGLLLLDAPDGASPGEECTARLEPLHPDLWDHVESGMKFTMQRGMKTTAHGEVLERLDPWMH